MPPEVKPVKRGLAAKGKKVIVEDTVVDKTKQKAKTKAADTEPVEATVKPKATPKPKATKAKEGTKPEAVEKPKARKAKTVKDLARVEKPAKVDNVGRGLTNPRILVVDGPGALINETEMQDFVEYLETATDKAAEETIIDGGVIIDRPQVDPVTPSLVDLVLINIGDLRSRIDHQAKMIEELTKQLKTPTDTTALYRDIVAVLEADKTDIVRPSINSLNNDIKRCGFNYIIVDKRGYNPANVLSNLNTTLSNTIGKWKDRCSVVSLEHKGGYQSYFIIKMLIDGVLFDKRIDEDAASIKLKYAHTRQLFDIDVDLLYARAMEFALAKTNTRELVLTDKDREHGKFIYGFEYSYDEKEDLIEVRRVTENDSTFMYHIRKQTLNVKGAAAHQIALDMVMTENVIREVNQRKDNVKATAYEVHAEVPDVPKKVGFFKRLFGVK